MDSKLMLNEAYTTSKVLFAMVNALRQTVLVTDDLKKAYNENFDKQLTLLAQQNAEFAKAIELYRQSVQK